MAVGINEQSQILLRQIQRVFNLQLKITNQLQSLAFCQAINQTQSQRIITATGVATGKNNHFFLLQYSIAINTSFSITRCCVV